MAANPLFSFLTTGDLIGDLTLVQAETITKDVIALGETCCLAVPLAYAETVLKTRCFLCSNSAII